MRVTRPNAQFQQWQALLTNRTKRHREGAFLVQGVRPITLAEEHDWQVRTVLYDADRRLSDWARALVGRHEAVGLSADLLAELAGKDAEVVAVVATRDEQLPPDVPDLFAVCLDRPSSPGNLGSVVRSADAFGAHGVVVAGHAADPYDPQAVRASTGSLFSLPVVRSERPDDVLDAIGDRVTVLGSDETGDLDLHAADLTGPVLLVVGNETRGMSAAWRERCDHVLRIPIRGSASSLNAANAATVLLYEAARQRHLS
ncbi:TrmH family RNA methyltransferase [Nocardioides mangrovicus]|uniref:TrmH family RNA methyltransferase n=1 Tax=Nocardioides mangrovicus TaxID=2478913 RepID=UPI001E5D35DB|nr:TrmH family RNA methyltransferase [Nocardioides mangrovicus]